MTTGNDMRKAEWLLCPVCHNKTRIKLRRDTILMHLPLFCPKCKNENLATSVTGASNVCLILDRRAPL
jgi:cytochrome c-type biogenesis protein CcmH/NrfF